MIDSRVAFFRRRRQCQRGQAPSRSYCSAAVIDNVNVSVLRLIPVSHFLNLLQFHRRRQRHCQRSTPSSQRFHRRRRRQRHCLLDQFPFCSFFSNVDRSVIVSVTLSRLAAFSSPSLSTASMSARSIPVCSFFSNVDCSAIVSVINSRLAACSSPSSSTASMSA